MLCNRCYRHLRYGAHLFYSVCLISERGGPEAGISLLIDSSCFDFSYENWQYSALICVFTGVHLTHAITVLRKKSRE